MLLKKCLNTFAGSTVTQQPIALSKLASALVVLLCVTAAPGWADSVAEKLSQEFRQIDSEMAGDLGVYVKHLGTQQEVGYNASRLWYLSSTVKVPLAIAVLQAVEAGELDLDDELVLKESDFVDGAGDLLWHQPGASFTIASLLEQSIENSDSVATDMLMRHLGVDAFNQQITESMVEEGFKPFTTILQVRYDAYGELHPQASELSNMDYVEIRSAGGTAERVAAFQRKLGLSDEALRVPTLEDAFSRYYTRNLNSGTLVAFGELLERLAQGELLNAAHTERVLDHMAEITTGEGRLQAGLDGELPFSQKTGTQIERACNVGIVNPREPDDAVVVATCAEDYGDISQAENAFRKVAEAISRHDLF